LFYFHRDENNEEGQNAEKNNFRASSPKECKFVKIHFQENFPKAQ
jgi:hypothetical protein